jgi:hypothetical protein
LAYQIIAANSPILQLIVKYARCDDIMIFGNDQTPGKFSKLDMLVHCYAQSIIVGVGGDIWIMNPQLDKQWTRYTPSWASIPLRNTCITVIHINDIHQLVGHHSTITSLVVMARNDISIYHLHSPAPPPLPSRRPSIPSTTITTPSSLSTPTILSPNVLSSSSSSVSITSAGMKLPAAMIGLRLTGACMVVLPFVGRSPFSPSSSSSQQASSPSSKSSSQSISVDRQRIHILGTESTNLHHFAYDPSLFIWTELAAPPWDDDNEHGIGILMTTRDLDDVESLIHIGSMGMTCQYDIINDEWYECDQFPYRSFHAEWIMLPLTGDILVLSWNGTTTSYTDITQWCVRLQKWIHPTTDSLTSPTPRLGWSLPSQINIDQRDYPCIYVNGIDQLIIFPSCGYFNSTTRASTIDMWSLDVNTKSSRWLPCTFLPSLPPYGPYHKIITL